MADDKPFFPLHKQRTPGFSIHEVTGISGRQGDKQVSFWNDCRKYAPDRSEASRESCPKQTFAQDLGSSAHVSTEVENYKKKKITNSLVVRMHSENTSATSFITVQTFWSILAQT